MGNFSLIDIAEHQWHDIAQLIDKLKQGIADQICCTSEAMAVFESERAEAARHTVWYTGGCTSWYLDSNSVPASWPWTYNRFVEAMAAPRWEDLECLTV